MSRDGGLRYTCGGTTPPYLIPQDEKLVAPVTSRGSIALWQAGGAGLAGGGASAAEPTNCYTGTGETSPWLKKKTEPLGARAMARRRTVRCLSHPVQR